MDVVCALLIQKQKILIAQRPQHKKKALLWEFPGGKVESGETLSQALCRELKEELDLLIDPKNLEPLGPIESSTLTLHFFITALPGALNPKEHRATAWSSIENLKKFSLCPLDQKGFEQYQHKISQQLKI